MIFLAIEFYKIKKIINISVFSVEIFDFFASMINVPPTRNI